MSPDYLSELPQARPHIHETRKFPAGFLWGSATSSYQVEGGNDRSDWHVWEREEGHISDGNVCGDACDHYRRYEEDFDLVAQFGQNAHRLSVEWSRIEPEEGRWDMDEVLHYRRVLEALKKREIRVVLTVWHFTLPIWFAEKGGWESRDAVRLFTRYAEFLTQELGDLVDHWVTINEPMVFLLQSYGIGVWPPGKKRVWPLFRVFSRLTKAHRAAYKAMRRIIEERDDKTPIGIAKNVITFEPYRRYSLVDSLFVRLLDRLFNHQFFFWTKGYHDYVGINYYFHYRIKYLPTKVSQFFYEVHTENREVSDLGWEINPEGMFEALVLMNRYKLPILITENGVANADDGKRPRVLVATLKEVYHAIKAGVDVRGYLHWSLLDNFEWEKGYSGRFGLVAVNFKTQERIPRRSAHVYAEICRENGIPHTLLRFLGHGVRW